ncbi:hypothetical protein COOONC_16923 [Cooperia oncophora]
MNAEVVQHIIKNNKRQVNNLSSGNPSEFDSFWELFEELVHKQPHSHIKKFSILHAVALQKGTRQDLSKMIQNIGAGLLFQSQL